MNRVPYNGLPSFAFPLVDASTEHSILIWEIRHSTLVVEYHWVKESTGGTLACITSTGFFTRKQFEITCWYARALLVSLHENSESYDRGIRNIRSVFVTNWNVTLALCSDNSRTYFLVAITIELWLCYFAITIEFNNGG